LEGNAIVAHNDATMQSQKTFELKFVINKSYEYLVPTLLNMFWYSVVCQALALTCLLPADSVPLFERDAAANISLQNPELFEFHRNIMAIDSTSGHETSATDYIANHLRSLNYTVELQPVHNPALNSSIRRENIYAYLGSNRTTRLLINSHVDTVPPYYPPSDDNENVYGRGANDAKGQIAVQLFAIEQLRKANKLQEGDLAILWDVGEEEYADGITAANSLNITPIWSITGEPTESYQATGHKGGKWVQLCIYYLAEY
jgi:acetylornithine deacetylase/succinyl-diaminopimelate desuccinylase-like protein